MDDSDSLQEVSLTKIRVKLGQAEAEVEADPEHLRESIELIPEVAAKLTGMGTHGVSDAKMEPAPQASGLAVPHGRGELPMVGLEKGDSLADVIGKFFADPWGRERRKLSDVREALQSYGMNYPKQSVAVALLRLAKATKVRRFKAEDGEYVYTTNFVGAQTQQQREESLDGLEVTQPN
jgi:hypothetical protein